MEDRRIDGLAAAGNVMTSKLLNPARGAGVPEETTMRYKVNGSAAMTDTSLVRARNVSMTLRHLSS